MPTGCPRRTLYRHPTAILKAVRAVGPDTSGQPGKAAVASDRKTHRRPRALGRARCRNLLHSGIAAPLDIINIDTDMIIPVALKTIKRTGLVPIFSMRCVLIMTAMKSRISSSIQHLIVTPAFLLPVIILVVGQAVSMRHGRCLITVSVR